jgi:hypothetical protein
MILDFGTMTGDVKELKDAGVNFGATAAKYAGSHMPPRGWRCFFKTILFSSLPVAMTV